MRLFIAVTWDRHTRSFSLSGRVRRKAGGGRRAVWLWELPVCPWVLLSFILFSLKSNPGLAPLWLQRCCQGKQRRGSLHQSSSPWCHRGGRWSPRRKPEESCSRMVPRSQAHLTPRAHRRSAPHCPTEVRGVHRGLQVVLGG